MNRIICLISFLILPFCFVQGSASRIFRARHVEQVRNHDSFCLVTLPKSGSFLILKAISEITRLPPVWVSSEFPFLHRLSSYSSYPWTHFYISPQLYSHLQNKKIIIMVRDLRDVCISTTYAIAHDLRIGKNVPTICQPDFLNLSFANRLSGVIKEESQMHPLDSSLFWNFSLTFPQVVAASQDNHVLVCRYEDLVGPKGGGDLKKQVNEIRRIANYLGITLDEQDVQRISSVIYGNSITYRKGQIGEWKKLFNADHKKLFKEKFGSYLIALGYESGDEW